MTVRERSQRALFFRPTGPFATLRFRFRPILCSSGTRAKDFEDQKLCKGLSGAINVHSICSIVYSIDGSWMIEKKSSWRGAFRGRCKRFQVNISRLISNYKNKASVPDYASNSLPACWYKFSLAGLWQLNRNAYRQNFFFSFFFSFFKRISYQINLSLENASKAEERKLEL